MSGRTVLAWKTSLKALRLVRVGLDSGGSAPGVDDELTGGHQASALCLLGHEGVHWQRLVGSERLSLGYHGWHPRLDRDTLHAYLERK